MPVNMFHALKTVPIFDSLIDDYHSCPHEEACIVITLPICEVFIENGCNSYPCMIRSVFEDTYKNLAFTYGCNDDGVYHVKVHVTLNDFGKFEMEHYLAYMYEQNKIFVALQENAENNVYNFLYDVCKRYDIHPSVITM